MTILLLVTAEGEEVNVFFRDVHKRLQSNDLTKNMFIGRAKKLGPGFFAVEMRSVLLFNLPGWALKLCIRKGLKNIGVFDCRFLSNKEAVVRLLGWGK